MSLVYKDAVRVFVRILTDETNSVDEESLDAMRKCIERHGSAIDLRIFNKLLERDKLGSYFIPLDYKRACTHMGVDP